MSNGFRAQQHALFVVSGRKIWYTGYMGNHRAGRLTLFLEGLTLQTKERRDVNGYICGLAPILYIRCRPCWSVLSDFQGQTKIAAITANNDG
jgi:hypothetical protein